MTNVSLIKVGLGFHVEVSIYGVIDELAILLTTWWSDLARLSFNPWTGDACEASLAVNTFESMR